MAEPARLGACFSAMRYRTREAGASGGSLMKIGRRVLLTTAALTVAIVATARAHTMFLKLESFFLEPHSTNVVALFNGDFDESENHITRDRMLDVSIVGPDGVVHPPTEAWRDTAMFHWHADSVDTALLTFETGSAGTYTIGVSTAARVIPLTGPEFNEYLVHEGLVDELAEREAAGKANDDAAELYSKHVKAIVQVGDDRSGEWAEELGYPVEIIPLQNPYDLVVGDELQVRFLRAGEPVENALLYANYEFNAHSHDETGAHNEAVEARTNADGVATIPLVGGGRWYIRTIHMVETPSEPDLDYESNWATLTFQIRGG
ncbi:MAG: DUF4198 domain-containing protein [Gemmatimonadales bacterium]|nr:DUF4198 domain-containing protein [Candidatus Palauibacter denitrificans]